jgi:hypothetical protein
LVLLREEHAPYVGVLDEGYRLGAANQ